MGTGEGLALPKVVFDLPFKSLIGELNKILIANNANDLTFTLGSDVVLTDQFNTFDDNTKQIFNSGTSFAGISDLGNVADPSVLANGDIFHQTTANIWRARLNGVTQDFVFRILAQILTNKTINATDNTITDTSQALGDILKNNGSKFVRFPRGTSLQVLRVNAGATDLEYATIAAGGEINTSSNVGTGAGIAKAKVVFDLPFKSFIGETLKIIITNNTNDLTFTLGTGIDNSNIAAGAAIAQSKLAAIVLANLPFGSAFQRYRTNSGATAIENFTENAEINFIIGNGTDVITTGIKVFLRIPFDCEVERWTVLSKDASSSIVVDINRYTSLANYDAGTKASIAGSDLPTLSSDKANESTALTGWTTVLSQGDILEAEVDSITTATRVTVGLRLNKRG